MDRADFLYIPHRPDSILYAPHLFRVGEESLLEWFIAWFSVSVQGQLYVLCHEDIRGRAAAQVAEARGVKAIQSAPSGQLKALGDAASLLEVSHVAVIPFGMAFAPPDLLSRVWHHHLAANNDYTTVKNFTDGAAPEIYSRDLINDVSGLRLPGASGELRRVVLTMLAGCASTGLAPPIRLAARAFDAATAYGAGPSELPAAIDLSSQRAVDAARPVLEQHVARPQCPSSLEALRVLKRILVEERGRTYDQAFGNNPGRHYPLTPPERRGRTRVLYVSNASAFSGSEEAICRAAAHVDTGRFEKFALVAREGHFTARLREAGAEVICPEHEFATGSLLNVAFLTRTLRHVQPDLVHFNSSAGQGCVISAGLLGVPMVQHVRVAEPALLGEALAASVKLIAVSEFVRWQILRMDVPPDRIQVVYDGIDTKEFRPGLFERDRARAEFGLPVRAKIVLMVARYTRYKRHDLLVKAAAGVRRSVPSLHLVFVGEEFPDEGVFDAVRGQVAHAGLSDAVTFLGFQPDIRKIEAAADVQVLCSDREPLGICALESMALGVPVIVTDSGGLRELVEDGSAGYVIPSGDASALAARLTMLLTDDRLAAAMGQEGRRTVEERANVKVVARQLMEVYESVTSAHRVPSGSSALGPAAPGESRSKALLDG